MLQLTSLITSIVIFSIWLAFCGWSDLTATDCSILIIQGVLPLSGMSVASEKLLGRALPLRARVLRGLAAILAGYVIWFCGWCISMFGALFLTDHGLGMELLNNSQAFAASFVARPGLPFGIGLVMLAICVVMRGRMPQTHG
jgi:hypothetical protein